MAFLPHSFFLAFLLIFPYNYIMKKVIPILLAIFVFVSFSRAFDLHQILEKSGDNKVEVKKFVEKAKQRGYQDWAEFLLSSMPDVDLVNLDSDDFISYLDALKKNIKRIAWRDKIDDNLFHYYILPHRVSQEPLENFAQIYADTLFELTKDVKDMREAALRINGWVYTKMKYEPTARWDQNATTTINRGIGRCEEMAILCVKALRTVCIPARDVYTPWWPFTNSNHAWVEVWVDGKWHALGGGELTDLDNAWFAGPSRRAAIIKGVVYGEMKEGYEPIYKKEDGFTIVNVTGNYADVTNLAIRVLKDNEPAESVSVAICVYNYSSLAPVGLKKTDKLGFTKFFVGKTDLFVYAYKDSFLGYKIWKPTSKDKDTVVIDISKKVVPDTSFWLHTRRIESEKRKSEYKPNNDSLHLLQQQHFWKVNIVDSSLASAFNGRDMKLIKTFYNAKGNAKSLLKYFKGLPDSLEEIFVDYFDVLPAKDIVSLDTSGLTEELLCIEESKKLVQEEIPDSIMRDYIVSDRILFEHIAKWRFCIQSEFASFKKGNTARIVDDVFMWVIKNIERIEKRGYFGPEKNPLDVFRTKRGVDSERYILIAGILRSIGIPARVKWSYDAVEYWDKGWKTRNLSKEEEHNKVWLSLKFIKDGKDVTKKQQYYYDFSITNFSEYPERLEVPVDTSGGKILLTLKDEPSYCVTGWRNGFGDTYVRIKKVLPTLDTAKVALNTGIPIEVKPGDLLVREYKGFNLTDFGINNTELNKGNVLIIVFDTESEASISTLNNAKDAINKFKGNLRFLSAAESKTKAEDFLKEMGIKNGNVYTVSKEIYKKKWRMGELPSVILLQNGKCIFWVEGLFLHLSRLLESLI